jgi:protein subunit release factor B
MPPVRFPGDAPVTAAKLDALRARIAQLRIALDRVEEQAVRAGGPGGQKVNKTSSGVRLAYALDAATVIQVKWTRERSRALNRFLALRELVDEIEERVSPATSARVAERGRRQKQKDRVRRRREAQRRDRAGSNTVVQPNTGLGEDRTQSQSAPAPPS